MMGMWIMDFIGFVFYKDRKKVGRRGRGFFHREGAKARGREGILIGKTQGNFHREDARALGREGICNRKASGIFQCGGGRARGQGNG